MRMHLVSNDIMSAVLKSNKCETCQKKKKTNSLTIERNILISSYFCTRLSFIVL